MVQSPAPRPPLELAAPRLNHPRPPVSDRLGTRSALHLDDHAPAQERRRQIADRGEHLGAEHVKRRELMAVPHAPLDLDAAPVAAVENRPHVLGSLAPLGAHHLGFVHQGRRVVGLNAAEQDRPGEDQRAPGPPHQELQNLEQARLAALIGWRQHGDVGRHVEGVDRMCDQGENREVIGGARREYEVIALEGHNCLK